LREPCKLPKGKDGKPAKIGRASGQNFSVAADWRYYRMRLANCKKRSPEAVVLAFACWFEHNELGQAFGKRSKRSL
jgi:hypothetical protein